ncbi:Thioesterase/thiol ester dehydrase-isomerase [Hesseltinella vesiculosa]|uniref:Thioesterase/thiol ester dehydrase-isomerase n=1 Tax=Hesseltinella vesiculosa TaxID=101127 RepID=A0A1X2GL18_9FUNG|nr:Thioesterase/thiol ester dehydrase-isomerase [Hesseltinella vesiculosa]
MKTTAAIAEKYPEFAEIIKGYTEKIIKAASWDAPVTRALLITDVKPGYLEFELEVQDVHCNMLGNIHGGCVATIIDLCSSMAIYVYEGNNKWKMPGISTDLTVSYMTGVSAGQKIRIVSEVQRLGKNLGNMYTVIYNEQGKACYAGGHTKYCMDARL